MGDRPRYGPGTAAAALAASLPIVVTIGVVCATLTRDPGYIVATIAPVLICYGLVATGDPRTPDLEPRCGDGPAGDGPPGEVCPDCGRDPLVIGTVRFCCPSPDTAAALAGQADPVWLADMRRLAYLDQLDAEAAALNPAGHPGAHRRGRWAR